MTDLAIFPIKCITLEEEIKKNSQLKMSDIQILREWCEKQPHLPKIQDIELAMFLHCNYYRIEPTKNTIENYYTIRTHIPEFFSNRDLLKMKELRECYKVVSFCNCNNAMQCIFLQYTFENRAQLRLEEKTKEGYSMMLAQFLDFNPSHYIFNDTVKCGFMVLDEFVWTHNLTPGLIYIADASNTTMGHVARLNPIALKKFAYYVQEAIPIRLIAIHVINMTPFVELIYNMFKPFLKTELLNLVHFHTTMESASKYFPIEALPDETGGKAGPIGELMDAQLKKIENFRDWYSEDEKIKRVNESLRIDKSKNSNTLFGVEGSFKKLEID